MDREKATKMHGIIEIDFDKPDIPDAVKNLQPILYKDGDGFCVMQDIDPMDGFFGRGKTEQEAMEDFQRHFEDQRLTIF